MVKVFNIAVTINLLNGEIFPCLCSKSYGITGNAGHSIPPQLERIEHRQNIVYYLGAKPILQIWRFQGKSVLWASVYLSIVLWLWFKLFK